MKKFKLAVYEYSEKYHENEITMIIFESGRFIFLNESIVTDIYYVGKILSIQNRKRHETYSAVKELYNLDRSQLSDKWHAIKHYYGKEWISGEGYGTAPSIYSKNASQYKEHMDFIPEKSDCPQI